MNFKDFLIDIDNFLANEQIFASYYYGYVNNVFTEKELKYPMMVYHTDAINHSILQNSILYLKMNFFVFDKLLTDNSNVLNIQNDLLKKLIKFSRFLKLKHYAENFNLVAISDEAYSEKITGWILDCIVKVDTPNDSCWEEPVLYLSDGITKYYVKDKIIIHCYVEDYTEIEMPNYDYYNGLTEYPVNYIDKKVLRDVKWTGAFNMKNLIKINNNEFYNGKFTGILNLPFCIKIGDSAFYLSKFTGNCNLPVCEYIDYSAFFYSLFNGTINLQVCEYVGDNAFYNSVFTGVFNCQKVKAIGVQSFYYSQFTGTFNCPNLTSVGDNAFRSGNFTGDFNCPNLSSVENYAFTNSLFTGDFNCPNLSSVGYYAFYSSRFTGDFNCPNLQTVGYQAFEKSNFSGSLSLPVCTQIGSSAFLKSNFTQITIGANATLGTGCIGAHSAEFINDYAANGKLAGTYVWDSVTGHWIYQN